MRMLTKRFARAAFLVGMLGLFPLLAGCGASGPKVVRVSGTLMRKNQPLPNVELMFHPAYGRPSHGTTDAAGKFSLNYTREEDGAVLGKHKVTLRARQYANPAEEFAGKSSVPADILALTEKYGDKDKTPLEIEITKATSDLVVNVE